MPGLGTGIGGGDQGDLGDEDNDGDHGNGGDPGGSGGIGDPSDSVGIATELSEQIHFRGGSEAPALPVMRISGQTGTAYLRVGVPQSYPNTQTRAPIEPYQGEELRYQVDSSGRSARTVTIDPVNRSAQIPTPLYTTQLSSPGAKGLSYSPEMQTFRANSGQADPYQVSFDLYRYNETLLSSAKVVRRPNYTQLPNGITQRTKDLAKAITVGAQTPYQQAKQLERHLKANYTYDFDFQGPPPDKDPVDWFLFEEKVGVCGSFNSAFVVMARSLGLPARIVTGYHVDPTQVEQLVTSGQAHAYSEVLFDNLGWVTFDATGSYDRPPAPTFISIDQAPDLVAGETTQITGRVTGGDGQPLDKVGVMLSLRSDQGEHIIGQGITEAGQFAIDAPIPPETVPVYYDLVAQVLSSQGRQGSADSVEEPVYAHTEIKLDPLTATRSLSLPLNGQLLQRGTNLYLPDEQLAATLATRDPLTKTPVTGEDGRFATEIRFEPTAIPGELPTKMRYKVSFPGEGLYLPTEVEGEVTIPTSGDRVIPEEPPVKLGDEKKPARPWWMNALVLAGLTALMVVGWRARHRLAALLPKRDRSAAPTAPTAHAPTPELTIELPEIEADLPLVWGVTDPLMIQVRSTSGEPLSGQLSLAVGSENPTTLPLGSPTAGSMACFTALGEQPISVLVDGRMAASKVIKIVSYRDEIIEDGQKLYHLTARDDARPTDRLTPREFAQLILSRGRELPAFLTRAFVDLFELATYSLEPIGRKHYVQFYRACGEIINGPQSAARSPQ